MNAAERLTVARILKVNHAGEYGAIRIYRAQIWVARRLYPDVVAFLEETLAAFFVPSSSSGSPPSLRMVRYSRYA